MRRVAVGWLLLGAATALVAGCGSGSPSTVAKAINLRAGDAPGFAAGQVAERRVAHGPFGLSTETCDGGLTSTHGVAGYSSRRLTYRYGHQPLSRSGVAELSPFQPGSLGQLTTARSIVYAFHTQSAARRELGVLGGADARACILRESRAAQAIGAVEGGAGRRAEDTPIGEPIERDVRVTPLQGLGGKASGLRETSEITFFPGHPRSVYRDSLGFVVGRTLVVFDTIAELQPFPSGTEQQLLALLHSRAEEHAL